MTALRWAYSSDEEHYTGECDSREAAIAQAIAEEIVEPGEQFWVGECDPPTVWIDLDADDCIERMVSAVSDDGPDGYGEDWPDIPAKGSPERAELDAILTTFNNAVLAWIEKHRKPTWFVVKAAERYVMPEPSASPVRLDADGGGR